MFFDNFDDCLDATPNCRLLVISAIFFLLLVVELFSAGPTGYFKESQNLASTLPMDIWQSINVFGDGRALFALLLPLSLRYRRLVWPLILSALVGWLIARGLKIFVHMPRPATFAFAESMSILNQSSGHNSFPSGHTVMVFSFVSVWINTLPKVWTLPLLGFAALVGFSRVAIGAHWPSDILAGAVIGCLSAYVGVCLSQFWRWGYQPRVHVGFVIVMWLAAMTIPFIDNGAAQSFVMRILLLCVALAAVVTLYGSSLLKILLGSLSRHQFWR